jgi:hypothetical protein
MEAMLDIEGPVRGEVFVVAVGAAGPVQTGPCGAVPWQIETHDDAHPMEVVRVVVGEVLGRVDLLHSTSWRWDHGAVVLTFLAVIGEAMIGDMSAVPIIRTELARGRAAHAPDEVNDAQVLEHALRHLAWLVEDDPEVADALGGLWDDVLAGYTPEPFRQLGGDSRA